MKELKNMIGLVIATPLVGEALSQIGGISSGMSSGMKSATQSMVSIGFLGYASKSAKNIFK